MVLHLAAIITSCVSITSCGVTGENEKALFDRALSAVSWEPLFMLGRIHTGSGSVPDSSEPFASSRLSVGFAFTLQTTDPPRTVHVHFAVYTLRLLRDRL